MKARVTAAGRNPDDVLIMPGLMPIIGKTDEEAQEKLAVLKSLVHPEVGLQLISKMFGDLSGHDPYDLVPLPLPESNGVKSMREAWERRLRETPMTIRQVRTYIGRTRQEAQDKFDQLQSLIDPLVGLSFLAGTFGDLSGFPIDQPIPEQIEGRSNDSISGHKEQLVAKARQRDMTIRDLYLEQAGQASTNYIGTASDIADVMEDWFQRNVCDGFNLTVPILPGGAEDVADLLVPELQRRDLFRTEYEGKTLRENLGLGNHRNRYTPLAIGNEK